MLSVYGMKDELRRPITQLAQKDTGSSANRHMRQILRIYNGASREMSLPLKN